MSANESKKKAVRVSVKPKTCPNPLFEKWLEEWKNEAASKGSDMQYCFGKALKSLRKYPLPLKTGRDCGVLDFFGNRLCIMLDRRLAEYRKTNPEELDCAVADRPTTPPQVTATTSRDNSKQKPQKRKSIPKDPDGKTVKVKKSREYVPAWRSGPYALLITLFNATKDPGHAGFLTKAQLQTQAQPLCDTSFKRPDPGSHYTAWSSMAGLVKRGLVLRQGCPVKFKLSDAGSELAQRLLAVDGKNTSCTDAATVSMEISDEDFPALDCPVSKNQVTDSVESVPFSCRGGYSSQIVSTATASKAPSTGYVKDLPTLQQESKSFGKERCKTTPPLQTHHDDTLILMPGSFDVILLVDKQETSGGPLNRLMQEDTTIRELSATGTFFELRHLKVGDYAWICRDRNSGHELVLPYIVERKRMDDLAKSIQDGRYREQKFRLKRCGIQNLIYLIESHGDNTHTTLPLQSLQQAAVNTQVVDKFTVKATSSLRESMQYLAILTQLLIKLYSKKTVISCKRENLPPSHIRNDLESLMMFTEFNSSSSKRKVLGTQSMFIKQLVQMNGLSVAKAQAIVERYPTPRTLMAAYQEAGSAGEKLLSGLRYGTMNRMLGPVISKSIYQLYTNLHLS